MQLIFAFLHINIYCDVNAFDNSKCYFKKIDVQCSFFAFPPFEVVGYPVHLCQHETRDHLHVARDL